MTQPGKAARPMPAGIVRPRLSGLDVLVLMWRTKWLMLAVFAAVFVAGAAGALLLPQTFTAQARILVSPIAPPLEADAPGKGAAGIAEAQVRSEAEVLNSPTVAAAAVKQVTLARAWPEIAHSCRPDTCERLGTEATQAALTVSAVPRSFVITAQLRHHHAAMSAELLNALVAAYSAYRETLFPGEAAQHAAHVAEIAKAEQDIRDYLVANGLTDLAAERVALFELEREAQARLLQAHAQQSQAEAELASYRRQLADTPAELDLYTEDTSQKALLELRLERQDKLARYRPDSLAVRDLDQRIEQMENFLESQAAPAGMVRRGPNPLYQQIEGSIAALQAEVQALGAEVAELSAQLEAIGARQKRLIELEPALKEIERRRDAAALAASGAIPGEGLRADQPAVAVRVLEPAIAPIKGESLKGAALLLSLFAAALAALAVGLVRASSGKGLPGPEAAERTLRLPVLASVRVLR